MRNWILRADRGFADFTQKRHPARVGVNALEKVLRDNRAEAGVAVFDRLIEHSNALLDSRERRTHRRCCKLRPFRISRSRRPAPYRSRLFG